MRLESHLEGRGGAGGGGFLCGFLGVGGGGQVGLVRGGGGFGVGNMRVVMGNRLTISTGRHMLIIAIRNKYRSLYAIIIVSPILIPLIRPGLILPLHLIPLILLRHRPTSHSLPLILKILLPNLINLPLSIILSLIRLFNILCGILWNKHLVTLII